MRGRQEAMRRDGRGRAGRAGVALLVAVAACAVNPATGERELSLVSESQEIQIGRESDPAITSQMGGLYPDSALQQYIRGVGMRLAASSERPSLPWSYKLLDDDLINAFALPGGFVYITRGILGYMNSEAEVAAVLGHETGHVTARHSASQITRVQLAQLGLGIGSIFSSTVRDYGGAAATGLQLLFLKYGRDDERQADELGFRYMTRIHYDPNGMSNVMRMLQSTTPAGGGGVPNWLSTHPDPGDRVQSNEQRITASGTDYSGFDTNRNTFVQHLDGLVFGEDPRVGYFIGTRFLQPTLTFEITFPAGWATQNGADAVQAAPPSQDGAMQLSFAQAASPAEATAKLTSVEGLTVLQSRTETINGMNASLADFDLASQDGVLRGTIAYIALNNAVYEILGYAPQAKWTTHSATVSAAIHSFARLTDRTYLDVSPNRIQIVRLPRAMTFAEFAQQYPSSVALDEVRLANQVSATETLPAGRLMKRVAGGRVPTR
jgi:predicted Zn-dependent protease